MKKLIQGVLFGIIFGFLLQKGGVTKYHILEGQLLLVDFTVMKVMLSAILVGMIGFYFLKEKGLAKPHIKAANLGANIIGGLIFGLGFALAGYCPGTGAAALGQGNLNALYYMGGMFIGSYVFAEFSKPLNQSVKNWLNKGEITLPDIFHLPERKFIFVFGAVLLLALIVLSQF
ncbi:MAG: YeeE/YedE family protein [Bacteriovoracaceae bacterium]|nr:YeeE/YedE family protein [Bacteriovoracaceae bacterium]